MGGEQVGGGVGGMESGKNNCEDIVQTSFESKNVNYNAILAQRT